MKGTPDSKVLIQGIDESLGSYYAARMKDYGTKIVAGISAGQGGQLIEEIPVFNLVEEAVAEIEGIDISLIFVDAYQVLDAALEAISAGIKQIIITSRGVPPLDTLKLLKKAQATNTMVLGPGSGGMVIPEKVWLGTLEPQFFQQSGKIGIISRTDVLCYEVALALNEAKMGQSWIVSIGNEGITGSSFEQWLQILEEDEGTEAIVLIGQSGGYAEGGAADYIANAIEKPVVGYIAGLQTPIKRPFKDAATVIATQLSYSPQTDSQENQAAVFDRAGVTVAKQPSDIPKLIQKALD